MTNGILASAPVVPKEAPMHGFVVREATAHDVAAIHGLITSHQAEGHLLPRSVDELRQRVAGFVVVEADGAVKACAELAALSPTLAEVRSLVVAGDARRVGLAARLMHELRRRARARGFASLCAFTHDARFFVRHDFSIVPHLWVPEKLARDCHACPLFQRCGQYAMMMSLRDEARPAVIPARRVPHVAVA